MKKLKVFILSALLSLLAAAFAQQYKIADVNYDITGITRKYALSQKIKIDKKRIFENEEEFIKYFKDLCQRFYNERNFDSSQLDFSVDKPNENNLCLVHINIVTVDSHHFLAVPYPKYNSNSGTNLKLKVKDTNFLGSLETLTSDISFQIEKDDDDDTTNHKWGLSTDFTIPFPCGPFEAKWQNDWSGTYTVGKSAPEYSISTGVLFSLPFDTFSLDWTFTHSFYRNFDYTEYDDEIYNTESGKFSIPITLQEIDNWGKIYYTPFCSVTYNWDKNSIDKENDDLSSPLYKVGHGISTERINWHENFRKGLSIDLQQSIGYNTQRYDVVPYVSAEAKIFLDLKVLGMCMDAYAFASKNSTTKIGQRLRGIKDDQKYDTGDPEIDSKYATRPDSAIVVNMDMPIHIFTFNFNNWKYLSFMNIFNCELQISPFFDFALLRNKATGTNFYMNDGFYAGGLEFLVYPQKWRSLVVRASAGVDLGRLIMPARFFNKDWRDEVSKYEIEIGVGLHY